jgi:uncharacterized protein DUF1275
MPMSLESNALHPWPYPSQDRPEVARWQRRLPPLLSAVAGMVDVMGFLSLGTLCTAHVTGNLVVIAALLVRGRPPNMEVGKEQHKISDVAFNPLIT